MRKVVIAEIRDLNTLLAGECITSERLLLLLLVPFCRCVFGGDGCVGIAEAGS
jgi:hypothetical protein